MRLERHILRELLQNFLFATAVVYFVMTIGLVVQLFSSREVPFQYSLTLAPVALLMRSELLTPLAFLVAVLFTYGRISAENEYLATQACGIHPLRLVSPVILTGLILSAIQAWILSFAVPNLWLSREQIIERVAVAALTSLEPSRTEFEAPNVGFYMTWKRREGLYFEDVFLDYKGNLKKRDTDEEESPVASHPVVTESNPASSKPAASNPANVSVKPASSAPPQAIEDSIMKGMAKSVELVQEPERLRFIFRGFRTIGNGATYEAGRVDLLLNTKSAFGQDSSFPSRPEFLTSDRLVDQAVRADDRYSSKRMAGALPARASNDPDMKASRKYWYEAERRVAWSLASVLFGMLGVPVAIWLKRGTRLSAMLASLGILFLLYYPLSKAGDGLAGTSSVPIPACAFGGTAVTAAVAAFFLFRLVRR